MLWTHGETTVIHMAGLIKEILLDYGLDRLAIDQKNDIVMAINGLIKSKVISKLDLYVLNLYLSGFTAEEIARQYYTTQDIIESTLYRLMQAIESASGYTDDSFIYKINKRRQSAAIAFLSTHGKTFSKHDVEWK